MIATIKMIVMMMRRRKKRIFIYIDRYKLELFN
jgi:hypothetical protein